MVLYSNALSVYTKFWRETIIAYSDNSCSFKSDPDPSRMDQIIRASSLIHSAAAFSQAIREDKLAPDEIRGVPLCMNQYWWLFGAARVPAQDGGRIRMDADARHIMVLCRGQIYSLKVLEGSGQVVDQDDLQLSLRYIVDDARGLSARQASTTALGVLTTENQQIWSRCRNSIVHHGLQNGRNLGIIDSSLFALCLDDSSPQSAADICMDMICGTSILDDGLQVGTCLNRWYDKLSIIVCQNGAAGMNFEHTCSDGSVDIRMACDIYEGSISSRTDATPKPKLSNGFETAIISSKPPTGVCKLQWNIPTDVDNTLHLARTHLTDRITQHQLETLDFTDYGSTYIKSKGFSPDAFFQMMLQAAYYVQYHQIRSGREPVVTRRFLHGRTDGSHTTTPEAATFARTFGDNKVSSAGKIQAFREATQAHAKLSKTVAQGMGHHRHLYVLHQLWKRRRAFLEANKLDADGEPTIFTDPGWSRLGTTILMGSNVENPSLAYAGFGPVAAEGFTVCYFIRGENIVMSVTSRNGEAERFKGAIERTLRELRETLGV